MKLQIMSDLHLEFLPDRGRSFADRMDADGVDVLVLAGDVILLDKYYQDAVNFFSRVCDKYPAIVYLPGNHEYYDSNPDAVSHTLDRLEVSFFGKIKILREGNFYNIGGFTFIGGTMWFPPTPGDGAWKQNLSDFHVIDNFTPWVYATNAACVASLEKHLEVGNIVVTHHLPSMKSVHPQYAGSGLNRFFVCEMDELILKRKPKLWIHGHSHSGSDYILGDTRVLANPKGYPKEGTSFNSKLVVEI